ncbi:hypothetical protein [Hyphomicrobium sp.]|uniref:hypothetical protein n=1 Tax=Hyphomicrobium sp. TaxID=82 RepID=UPI002FE06925
MARNTSPFRKTSKPTKPPAPRNTVLEQALCNAIAKRLRVSLQYEDDMLARTFEPHAVYHTSTGKVCVAGNVTANPNDYSDKLGPHNFEVGRIRSVRATEAKFIPDPRFDRHDAKYSNGILCAV